MRTLPVAALFCGLALSGCDSFDPLDKFQDWDIMSSKKPLPGERRPVFPEGVPGVPQGVPPDMVKGYQPPAEAPPPVIEAKPARPKPKTDRGRPAPSGPAAAARDAGGACSRPDHAHPAGAAGRRGFADHAGRAADLADRRAARADALSFIPTLQL